MYMYAYIVVYSWETLKYTEIGEMVMDCTQVSDKHTYVNMCNVNIRVRIQLLHKTIQYTI